MRALIGFLLILLLTGCEEEVADAVPEENACGAASMSDLIGRSPDVFAAMILPVGSRIIYPGMPITQDYRPDRINFDIGPDNRITRVWCG